MHRENACGIEARPVGFSQNGVSDDEIFVRKSRHYVPTERIKTPKISVKTVDQIEGLWCILNVQKCGLEFAVERHLKGLGVETFIARQEVKKRCWVRDSRYDAGGYWAIRYPIVSYFPTYLFAATKDDTDRHHIIEARAMGMEHILDVHETDQLDLLETLRSLEKAYGINPKMPSGTWQKKPGDRVRVTAGAFMGLMGEIVRIGGKSRLHIGIKTLGQPVELEIDPDDCEAI